MFGWRRRGGRCGLGARPEAVVMAGVLSCRDGVPGKVTEFGEGLRNAQMVTSLLLASGRADVDAVAVLLHPDFRVIAIPGLAPARGYQSRDEFLGYFDQSASVGQHIEPDLVSLEVRPNGSIVVEGRLRVLTAGEETHTDAWFVYTFRDGLIASLGNYLDARSAEAAVAA